MEIIWDIGLQTIEILTLIFGILGMTISVMLLFSPSLAKSLSTILNRNVDVDKKLEYLDKEIEITEFFYKHHFSMGALLIAGSLFCLFFFFFLLDINKFAGIFFWLPKARFFCRSRIEIDYLDWQNRMPGQPAYRIAACLLT